MPKIIVDTNVLVSSLIQTGYSFFIIDFVFSDKSVELCISDDLLKEYVDVLTRRKFFKYPEFIVNAKILLSDIEKYAVKYYPVIKPDIIKDYSDNKLLELAETCHAKFLITGNSNDFLMRKYKKTRIISPKEFWELEINKS
jgi:putative PIN family toxin of toxin-antitoxin system